MWVRERAPGLATAPAFLVSGIMSASYNFCDGTQNGIDYVRLLIPDTGSVTAVGWLDATTVLTGVA